MGESAKIQRGACLGSKRSADDYLELVLAQASLGRSSRSCEVVTNTDVGSTTVDGGDNLPGLNFNRDEGDPQVAIIELAKRFGQESVDDARGSSDTDFATCVALDHLG